MSLSFDDKTKKEADEILSRYPTKEAAILPFLHLAQREFGYISEEVAEYVAQLLGFSPARIYGIATFYTMYNRTPVGKYHVQVCKNISCSLLGAKGIIEHISDRLGIAPGETTDDGKFTLTLVECLGSCGSAPVMQVNDDYYENLTTARVDEILEELA